MSYHKALSAIPFLASFYNIKFESKIYSHEKNNRLFNVFGNAYGWSNSLS
jgi:hypothetical protein